MKCVQMVYGFHFGSYSSEMHTLRTFYRIKAYACVYANGMSV